jgi:BlaI family transcriptional regulator, penicillinase repressor
LTKAFVILRAVGPKAPKPTRAELDILHVLWAGGPLSVRDVQRTLNDARPTGYTSVLKTMQIMLEKGLLDRDDTRRPQMYRARYSRDRTQKQFVSEVLQQVYRGSLKALVMHAAGTRKPSADDIEEIEAFLRDLKRDQK